MAGDMIMVPVLGRAGDTTTGEEQETIQANLDITTTKCAVVHLSNLAYILLPIGLLPAIFCFLYVLLHINKLNKHPEDH